MKNNDSNKNNCSYELTVTHTVNGKEVSEKDLYRNYRITDPFIARLIASANDRIKRNAKVK